MTPGKIKVPKLPFDEYLKAQIAILDTAIFKSVWLEVYGTKLDEQDEIWRKETLKEQNSCSRF